MTVFILTIVISIAVPSTVLQVKITILVFTNIAGSIAILTVAE